MHFEFHRHFKFGLASWIFACATVTLCADDSKVDSQSAVSERLPVEPFWLFIPFAEPLDLSELLESLGEIPALEEATGGDWKSDWIAVEDAANRVALAAASDEPIVIGHVDSQKKIESTATGPTLSPSNPLRKGADETPKPTLEPPKIADDSPKPAEPSPPPAVTSPAAPATADASLPALELIDEADKHAERLPDPVPVARPRPKMVEVKPITQDEQESPRLPAEPSKIDSRQARDEDENAIAAKRPEAASKTFVGKPSASRPANQGHLSSTDPTDLQRSQRVESCLAYYLANPESVVERSPWAVMHAMLPFGVEGEIVVGSRRVNSIQWMCYNGTCRTQKLFTPAGNYFRPNVGGGVQGHEGQFLAMLAQSQVAAEYPIVVGQKKFTVTDLIRYEMATCKEKSELTFKLMGLSYYVNSDQVWLTDKRSRWNIEKLVKEELAQPINGAACGGTHRLMGLTFAVRQRQAEGHPIDGQFARADRFVKDFVDYAWKLQNPDGSFSTNWFESRGNDPNMERKIQTTGHILEWLAFTLPEHELSSPRFTKSIDFLLSQIWDHRRNKWPIGPRGHATRAIALYHQRTTGIVPGQRQSKMADQIQSLRSIR